MFYMLLSKESGREKKKKGEEKKRKEKAPCLGQRFSTETPGVFGVRWSVIFYKHNKKF